MAVMTVPSLVVKMAARKDIWKDFHLVEKTVVRSDDSMAAQTVAKSVLMKAVQKVDLWVQWMVASLAATTDTMTEDSMVVMMVAKRVLKMAAKMVEMKEMSSAVRKVAMMADSLVPT